ncbi:MAG: leucyl aminopeptidase [Candidatus Wallbacteria bacterium]|nr:leucyl aminopeptidase [Candidatus Wallbacteria bacterium]
MEIEVRHKSGDPLALKSDALLTFLFDDQKLVGTLARADERLDGWVSELVKAGEITGKRGNLTVLHARGVAFKRLFIVGLGKRESFELDFMRNEAATAARKAREIGCKRVSADVPHELVDGDASSEARSLTEGIVLANYKFTKYLSGHKERYLELLTVISATKGGNGKIENAVRQGDLLAHATQVARDMCNEPSNVMTPAEVVRVATGIARRNKLPLKVLKLKDMQRLGMGMLMGVAKGSAHEPFVVVMEHRGDPKSKEWIALVGKGITFDSGGISIKPSSGMHHMKRDMTGAAIVVTLMDYFAKAGVRANVVSVAPTCENMPGGNAYKPGDILRSMSGKYVEITNTDAEGRLILGDAMTYVQRQYKPSVMIDVATLTGGALMALGAGLIPAFSNDDELYAQLEKAGKTSGEPVYRLPLYPIYKKGIRSYFADVKNSSFSAPATIKGALFLDEFVEKPTKWAHLDIAAVFAVDKDQGIFSRGGTAVGMRVLAHLVHLMEKK